MPTEPQGGVHSINAADEVRASRWRPSQLILVLGRPTGGDRVTAPPALLAESLPSLAIELATLLRDAGHEGLAEQIPHLRVYDRCRCADEFCATVYTAPRPKGSWGPRHENVTLDPANGMLILDVVDGNVTCIEVLDRDDVRAQVLARFP